MTRLKRLREEKGITQKELASDVGMSIETLRKLDQGKRDIKKIELEVGVKIAQILGITAEELIKEE